LRNHAQVVLVPRAHHAKAAASLFVLLAPVSALGAEHPPATTKLLLLPLLPVVLCRSPGCVPLLLLLLELDATTTTSRVPRAVRWCAIGDETHRISRASAAVRLPVLIIARLRV
jgi:hypothetical protein